MAALSQARLGEHIRGAAEGIGWDEIRTRVDIGLMDPADDVRAREVQVLVASLAARPAEIVGRESIGACLTTFP